jgi:hypothetical protein
MKMRERLASIISPYAFEEFTKEFCSPGVSAIAIARAFDTVDAILAEMENPTEEMIDAVWEKTGDPCWKENARDAFIAGIKAIRIKGFAE